MYALGVGLCAVGLTIVHHPYFFCGNRVGMWLRVSACSLVYKKVGAVLTVLEGCIWQTWSPEFTFNTNNVVHLCSTKCCICCSLWYIYLKSWTSKCQGSKNLKMTCFGECMQFKYCSKWNISMLYVTGTETEPWGSGQNHHWPYSEPNDQRCSPLWPGRNRCELVMLV